MIQNQIRDGEIKVMQYGSGELDVFVLRGKQVLRPEIATKSIRTAGMVANQLAQADPNTDVAIGSFIDKGYFGSGRGVRYFREPIVWKEDPSTTVDALRMKLAYAIRSTGGF